MARLTGILRRLPKGTDAEILLDAMLRPAAGALDQGRACRRRKRLGL
jgi:hypothetical protein